MAELYGNLRKNLGKNDYGNLGKNCYRNLAKNYYWNFLARIFARITTGILTRILARIASGNLGKNLGKIYYENLGKNLGNNYFNLTLTLLFHRSYSTNSVKPKPGAYTACGQNDRNYFI